MSAKDDKDSSTASCCALRSSRCSAARLAQQLSIHHKWYPSRYTAKLKSQRPTEANKEFVSSSCSSSIIIPGLLRRLDSFSQLLLLLLLLLPAAAAAAGGPRAQGTSAGGPREPRGPPLGTPSRGAPGAPGAPGGPRGAQEGPRGAPGGPRGAPGGPSDANVTGGPCESGHP
ncbi:hypothetical protein ENH_00057700 [Eimeria necatrix]|uniref:Uncharacterized protein n=1 Tax=Eimeria necatrix TaxID=51315 RepID=U6MXS8_9EIME|nr:hypothetical protein ENH_00057700 [Eimeria necatrix]CDJ68766.1 hypothetical protein ENH_00057700 [Eimeria necatrix]